MHCIWATSRTRYTTASQYLAAHAEVGPGTTGSDSQRDLQRHFRAVLCRRAAPIPDDDGAAWEARVRFWHAMLTWEHPEFFPGQFKPTPNFVRKNPLVAGAKPVDVAGTLLRLSSAPIALIRPLGAPRPLN